LTRLPLIVTLFLFLGGGLYAPVPVHGADAVTSVCAKHDFSSGGNNSCVYCHNAEEPTDAAFTITPQSQGCLTCHDGSTPEATQHLSPGSTADRLQRPFDLGRRTPIDHPFGVLYQEARSISPTLKLRPVPLSGSIKLYDGKVECASCHSPHDCSQKPFLRMSNEKSALCMTCHEM
jgi:predicted CXXCH cytochrome family protein